MKLNLGLFKGRNLPLYENSFDTNDTASVNIYKNTANLNINIPVLNEDEGIKNMIFPISLVYSHSHRNVSGGCGYGVNLGFMKKITNITYEDSEAIKKITIKNSDYTEIDYEYDEDKGVYSNSYNDTYIVFKYAFNENNVVTGYDKICLYDLSGNCYQFNYGSIMSPIEPEKIIKANKEEVLVSYLANGNMELSQGNYKIVFTKPYTKVNEISYYNQENLIKKVSLIYSRNNLSKIIKNNIYIKSYQYNNAFVITKNLISGKYSKYYMNDDKVTKIVNGYEENENSGKKVEFSYYDNYTEVTDYKGRKTIYSFNSNGKIDTINNNYINYSKIIYDEHNRIIEQTNPIDFTESERIKKNDLTGEYFEGNDQFEYEYDYGLDITYEDYEDYGNQEYANMYKIINTTSTERILKFNILNVAIKKGSGLMFVSLYKMLTEPLNFNEKNIKIRLINTDKEVEDQIKMDNFEFLYTLTPNDNVISKMFIAEKDYNKIEIEITIGGYGEMVIKAFQIFNHLYGTINNYDSKGVLKSSYSGENVRKGSYLHVDNTLIKTSTVNNYNDSITNYDENYNPVEVLYGNGIIETNTYDDNNNLIKKVIKNVQNKYIEYKYIYNNDKTLLVQERVNGEIIRSYTYDEKYNVNSIKQYKTQQSDYLHDMYNYNTDLTLKEHLTMQESIQREKTEFVYNSNKTLDKILLNNNYYYKFNYDTFGNVSKTLLKNNNLEAELHLETNEYEVNSDGVYTENLKNSFYGNSISDTNKLEYTYDVYDNLKEVYQVKQTGNELLYEFTYDSYNKLTEINDYKNSEITTLTYDENDNLVEEKVVSNGVVKKVNYKYDIKDNLLSEMYKEGNTVIDSYGYILGEKQYYSPVKVHNYYKNYDEDLYTNFLLSKNLDGTIRTSLTNGSEEIKIKDDYTGPDICDLNGNIINTHSMIMPKAIIHYDNSSEKMLGTCYKFINEKNNDDTYKSNSKTVGCWFKVTDYTSSDRIMSSYNYHYIYFDIRLKEIKTIDGDTRYKIVLYSNDDKNHPIESENYIKIGAWNFVSVTYEIINEKIYYKLNLNGVKVEASGYKYVYMLDDEYIHFGDNGYSFPGIIHTCLFLSKKAMTNDEVNEMYKYTYDNYINYNNNLSDECFNKNIITSRYTKLNNYTVIPLKNSFESINNDVSYTFNKNSLFNDRLEDLFVYKNYYLNDYALNIKGHELYYDFEPGYFNIVGIKGYFKEYSDNRQTIFTLCNYNNNLVKERIGLCIDFDGKVYVGYKDINLDSYSLTDTLITVTNNEAHNYYLSVSLDNVNYGVYTYKVSVKVDSEVKIVYITSNSEISLNRIIVGSGLEIYDDFDGLVSMLTYSTTYGDINSIDIDLTERYVKKVNNLGQLYTERLYRNEDELLRKDITYKEEVVNRETKCYNTLKEEKFYTKSLAAPVRTISYEVDKLGNVTNRLYKQNTTVLNDISYTYDYAGRLTKETDSAGKRREYTYDSHSNMTESVVKDSQNNVLDNKVYTYSTNFPHLLMSYTKNGQTVYINYDAFSQMYPVRIYSEDSSVEHSLEWENKQLIKYTLDYTGNKYLSFKYNESGQRVKKTLTHTITGDKVHKYKYFGNKLIEEYIDDEVKGETETLQFMYDESGLLYGFRYNGVEYYYLRDSLQTILGIIDVNKNVVCEYEYDAWGNHRVLDASRNENGSKYFIGNINPFRYKGYYYDVETNLFLVSSRYYSPELCRWISPDDIEYLDPESVNGLNLYCYCANNPIMNIDPDGHAWYNVLGWIGLGLVAAAATVLTCGAFGVAVGGAGLLGAVIHGAAVGALIGAGAGAALGAVGGMVYDAYQGNDFGTSIWEGVQAGFGIGAIAGAVIGGAAGYIGYQPTQITGFTKHGINNAISKNGHGVNERALLDTIKNPNKIVPQAFRSKFKFVGKDAVVVLNKTGKVITTWAKHRTGWRFGIGLWLGYELTQ